MIDNKQIIFGFTLMGLWSLTTAFSHVLTGSIDQDFQIPTLCFYIFSTTTLIFTIINFKNLPVLLKKCIRYKQDIILINITSVGCWSLLIYPLKYIEPSVVGAIYLGIGPIVSLLAGKFLYKNQKISVADYLVIFSLTILVLYLSTLCLSEHSAVENIYSLDKTIIALVCTLIGGITLGFNTLFTKRISTAEFSPIDILTVRFILLIFLSGLFHLFFETKLEFSFINVKDILLVTFCMIIIPQLLFQNSINRIDPISTAIIALLMPVLTFFIEFADQRLHPNVWTIIGVLLVFIIATIGVIARYKTEKSLQKT